MMRPGDQAKLLFLYLLRSSAALASEPLTSKVFPASAGTSSSSSVEGQISLRLARRTDIPQIQRCNLATLPENYNANFYMHHIRTWPELAMVMEHIPPGSSSSSRKPKWRRKDISILGGRSITRVEEETPAEIIGYVLGKVNENPITNRNGALSPSKVNDYDSEDGFYKRTELLGHVTSLAIMKSHRRKGLANVLMEQLHHNMKARYRTDAVGLHVRVSNKAATSLYALAMGYKVDEVIKGYYSDGEDAYFMRKELFKQEEKQAGNVSGKWLKGVLPNWDPQEQMDLPRLIMKGGRTILDVEAQGLVTSREEDEQQQVLTG